MPDEVRGEKFVVHLTDEDLIWVEWAAGTEISDADARALIDAIAVLSGGVVKPALVDGRSLRSVERDARILLSSTKVSSRIAVIVGSALSRTLANFSIGLSRPDTPMKVFDDTDAARTWLREAE